MGHRSDNDFANVNKTLFQHHNLVQVFLGEEVNKISAQSTQDPKCVRYSRRHLADLENILGGLC